jgi:hypothetical protein
VDNPAAAEASDAVTAADTEAFLPVAVARYPSLHLSFVCSSVRLELEKLRPPFLPARQESPSILVFSFLQLLPMLTVDVGEYLWPSWTAHASNAHAIRWVCVAKKARRSAQWQDGGHGFGDI